MRGPFVSGARCQRGPILAGQVSAGPGITWVRYHLGGGPVFSGARYQRGQVSAGPGISGAQYEQARCQRGPILAGQVSAGPGISRPVISGAWYRRL